jgi:hypothetical protein
MMRKLAIAAVLGFAVGRNTLTSQKRVHVRLQNGTPWVVTNVTLTSPGNTLHADRLAPGAVSRYERQDGAFRYGALDLVADNVRRRLTPIDYDGEVSLPPGDYTYVILYAPVMRDGVFLQLQRDR